MCRKVQNCKTILKQCQDRNSGTPGGLFILVLEDAELRHMLSLRAKGQLAEVTKQLDDKLRDILRKT